MVIKANRFTSLGMAAADACLTALGEVGGVDQVRSVKALDGETGALMRELPYLPNANAGPSFAAILAPRRDDRLQTVSPNAPRPTAA